jgi:hypothetical protein
MVKPIIIYWNIVKLVFIVLVCIIFLFAPVFFFNICISHFPCFIAILIGSLPLLSLIFCLLKNGNSGDIRNNITSIRYDNFCPLLFQYDPRPDHFRFKNIKALKDTLQPYDILLRRQERYLEGLVLEQTSYFTHAAIYYGNKGQDVEQVIQAVGGTGVGPIGLDEFARCDEIAVLRFNMSLVEDEKWKDKPHKIREDFLENINLALPNNTLINNGPTRKSVDLLRVVNYDPLKNTAYDDRAARKKVVILINEDINCKETPGLSEVGKTEKDIFDYFIKSFAIKKRPQIDISRLQTFMPTILTLCDKYKGRPYDFGFNFADSESLSCVEFVWGCYKALFPLHQIRRDYTYYFKWVRTLVIVPDQFLTSEFFTLQYSSVQIPDTSSAPELYKFAAKTRLNFFRFVFKIVAWQLAILFVLYLFSGFRKCF